MTRAVLGRLRGWVGGGTGGPPPAPFVVGAGHSGTTLLRLMLDAHPDLAIPPETNFLPDLAKLFRSGRPGASDVVDMLRSHRRWGDFSLDPEELRERLVAAEPLTATAAARAFYRLYADGQGKPRWGDKTPGYGMRMPRIERILPEARFIHLIRDGRDVALSALRERQAAKPHKVAERAEWWRRRIERARRGSRRVGHYVEIRYEDLVLDTEPTLRRVCELAELRWDDGMLRYHERASERLAEMADALPPQDERDPEKLESPEAQARRRGRRLRRHALTTEPPRSERVARWRRQMPEDSRAAFEEVAGDLLRELGYETGVVRAGEPAR